MRDHEKISFLFVTATSGSMDGLVARTGLKDKESVINQALIFYSYYLAGAYENGPFLVKGDMKLKEVNLDEFEDNRTADHYDADTIDVSVDMDALLNLTRRAHKKDPADTLTAALILYEKIYDAMEAGLNIGHFDPKAHRGCGEFTELTPKQKMEPAVKTAVNAPPETIPPKYQLH